jgi:hypothetical protein
MPFIILILTAIGGAIWFWVRNNPRDALDVAADAATTLRNAPRRLAFRKQSNAHPTEGIDDPRIAICSIAQAFIELDDLPTAEQRHTLKTELCKTVGCTDSEAEEMLILGRWLMTQCNGPENAVPRLSKRLYKIDGSNSFSKLQAVLVKLVQGELSSKQVTAIEDVKQALRV